MRLISALVVFVLALGASVPALADASVVVLGLRSVEGDDELANQLTDELRQGAREVDGWAVLERKVSMAQMTLAHGCEDVDPHCLSDIAEGLGAQRIIYGTMNRTSTRDDYDFSLRLGLFDAETGSISETTTATFPRQELEQGQSSERAKRLILHLSGVKLAGSIVVQANIEHAQVNLNGQPIGEVEHGSLIMEQLQPGSYEVEITADGYRTYRAVVAVQEGSETTVAAALEEGEGVVEVDHRDIETSFAMDDSPGRGPPLWVGYTLLGVAGASVAGMVASWFVINSVEEDELYVEYREAVYQGNQMAAAGMQEEDVCQAAQDGLPYSLTSDEVQEVSDLCGKADTFQVLQWVFLGTAVVAGGLGLYFVLTHEDPGEVEANLGGMPLTVRPRFDTRSARLDATLHF